MVGPPPGIVQHASPPSAMGVEDMPSRVIDGAAAAMGDGTRDRAASCLPFGGPDTGSFGWRGQRVPDCRPAPPATDQDLRLSR